MTHELKCHPEPFDAVLRGVKRFEIRREDDRKFSVGDLLLLEEWFPDVGSYTGRFIRCKVTYIARDAWGLPPGLCVMSLILHEVAP